MQHISEIPVSFMFLMIMSVLTNFNTALLTKKMRIFFETNMMAKHGVGFTSLLLLLLFRDDRYVIGNMTRNLIEAMFLYVLFVALLRNGLITALISCALGLTLHFVNIRKGIREKQGMLTQEHKAGYERTIKILRWVVIIVTISGMILNIVLQRLEEGPSFNLGKFMLGNR